MKRNNFKLMPGFWGRWSDINAQVAIFHQWDQLEQSGCIDNFRILAEGKEVFRKGWYFADSDAYKWLEAAFIILAQHPDPELKNLVDPFVDLIQKTQAADGYLYTFNQFHFPGIRWVNMQIEHELYCHGHLIEAFVSGAQVTGYQDYLAIACKAADRIVADFLGKGSDFTPGHEEIEIALLRLFEVTQKGDYLDLASQFLEQRGRGHGFGLKLLQQASTNAQRVKQVKALEAEYQAAHPGKPKVALPASNTAKKPKNIKLRWTLSTLSGKFFQQHRPLKKQTKPVGHAVRFVYLETAAAMFDRLTGQRAYLETLEKSWQHMVEKRMYITGGLGSLPMIEGFGRDYELDPEFAYTETCAALGSLFWNREMAKLTGKASYSDLFEWQLYNAALVGMGVDGTSYFYNNPLKVQGGIERRSWYEVPCCPSNLSRTLGGLHKDILNIRGNTIEILQFISSRHTFELGDQLITLEINSDLPWEGRVQINFLYGSAEAFKLRLRQPSWASVLNIWVNGEVLEQRVRQVPDRINPDDAVWIEIERLWAEGDQVVLAFELPLRILRADERVKSVHGKAALARGPLVYCLESVDNPDVNIFSTAIDYESLHVVHDPVLLGGCWLMHANSLADENLTLIPYHLWGNRGPSQMTVFVNIEEQKYENMLAA
jgi:DUF1680 family protein